jgi:hypothetical protein
MIEAKKGGLSVYVVPTKLVGDVAVGVCFPLTASGCALARLNGGCDCRTVIVETKKSGDSTPKEILPNFPAGSEEACMGYSLFLAVEQSLCGDPLAVAKTKVGEVKCGAHNGMFYINWKVKGTVSAARKSLGIALKNLNPLRMASAYVRCVKTLGGPNDKAGFLYVADKAASGIKNSLTCGVVGNIKIDNAKLNDMLDTLSKKHVVSTVSGTKTKPADHTPCNHADHTEIKVSGWSSAALADYIKFRVKGVDPLVCDDRILLPMKSGQWDTIAKKIKKGVKDYVNAKYAKVSTDLPAVYGYSALSKAALCSCDVRTVIKSGLSTATVEGAISKHL